MSEATVASEVLNFTSIKRRSAAARNYRIKINPTNWASSFTGSNSAQLEFALPSSLQGSYTDFSNMYFKFTATNTSAINLDKAAAYGYISRMELFTAGSQICSVNNFNVLAATLMETDATIGYKGGYGKVLSGLQSTGSLGEYCPAGTERTYCLPLILLPFSMQRRLIPLFSLDSLRIRFTFESPSKVYVGAGAANGYSIKDAQLCGYVCELSPDSQARINAMTGGVYNILCPCWSNIATVQQAGTTAVAASLGISVTSLERILIVHRNQAADVSAKQTLGARITNGLTSFQFNIDGQLYPQNPILIGDSGAEIAAEHLLSSASLSDFRNDAHIASQTYASTLTIGATANASILVNSYESLYSYLNIPATSNVSNAWFNAIGDGTVLAATGAAGTVSNAGSFVASIELENSTSSQRSDLLYSGVQTMGAVVQYLGTYAGGASTVAAFLDFFCYYTIMCTLDMRGTGVWQVSV